MSTHDNVADKNTHTRARTHVQSGTLRKINSVVLPIVYSEKFYKQDVLDAALDDINKLGMCFVERNEKGAITLFVLTFVFSSLLFFAVYYADIPVGACCCRLENVAKGAKEAPTLAILTLA